MSDFKATHRYLGGDELVVYFNAGDLVSYRNDWEPNSNDGVYMREDGTVQIVEKQYMEAL